MISYFKFHLFLHLLIFFANLETLLKRIHQISQAETKYSEQEAIYLQFEFIFPGV